MGPFLAILCRRRGSQSYGRCARRTLPVPALHADGVRHGPGSRRQGRVGSVKLIDLEACDVVLTSLPDDPTVRSVTLDQGGLASTAPDGPSACLRAARCCRT